MKTKIAVIVMLLLLAALPVGVALADAQGPNSEVFVDVICEDGTEFDMVISPAEPSVVGQDANSNVVGIVFSVNVLAGPGGPIVETLVQKQGNPNTIWCEWVLPTPEGDIYFGGDVLGTPGGPPNP